MFNYVFLEECARFSLKLATKGLVTAKKNCENLAFQVDFLKEKRRNATKISEIFLIKFGLINVVELQIFWKYVHAFQ